MENRQINSYTELIWHISLLKEENIKQEEELKHKIKDFAYSLNPLNIIKNSLHKLTEDKEVQLDLTQVILNYGSNFIIEKIFGNKRHIGSYLTKALIERLTSWLIKNNLPDIVSTVTNFFHREPPAEGDSDEGPASE
jgi:hypothetical protein